MVTFVRAAPYPEKKQYRKKKRLLSVDGTSYVKEL